MKAIRLVVGPLVAFVSLAGVVTGAAAQTCAVTEFPCEVSELNEGTAAADGVATPTTTLPDDEFLMPRYNTTASDSDTDSGDSESDGGESETD